MSTHISSVDAQANLDQLCDRVTTNNETLIITRSNGQNVALISEAELNSILETLYLLQSPDNAVRLFTAMKRAEAGTIAPQTVEEVCQQFGLEEDNEEDNNIAAAS
jgi:antitoxin YefM